MADLEEEKNKTPEKESKEPKVSRSSTPKSKKGGKAKAKVKSSKNSSEAASDSSDTDENTELYLSYFEQENCYKGHVEDYDVGYVTISIEGLQY